MNLKILQFNEALDKPYPYRWTTKDKAEGYATFKTKDGRNITVAIEDPFDEAVYNIEFMDTGNPISRQGLTWGGDQFKILATVLKAISEYVKEYYEDMDRLEFSGEKAPTQKRKGDSGRQRVYERLFKKYTPPGNWNKKVVKDNWRTKFIYTKKK
jgi:hypothetical protein